MRFYLAFALCLPVYVLAQDAAPPKAPMPEPKNLKILKGMTREQVIETMRSFRVALGVQCNHCHVQGAAGSPPDFASDDNPKKEIARNMILMAREINGHFPADGKMRVRCYTCHRGAVTPLTSPPPEPSK